MQGLPKTLSRGWPWLRFSAQVEGREAWRQVAVPPSLWRGEDNWQTHLADDDEYHDREYCFQFELKGCGRDAKHDRSTGAMT